jgi:hypothetical protein
MVVDCGCVVTDGGVQAMGVLTVATFEAELPFAFTASTRYE